MKSWRSFPAPSDGLCKSRAALCLSSPHLQISYISAPKPHHWFFGVDRLTKIYFWEKKKNLVSNILVTNVMSPFAPNFVKSRLKVILWYRPKILLIIFGIQIILSSVLTVLVKGSCPSLHFFICLDNCYDLLYAVAQTSSYSYKSCKNLCAKRIFGIGILIIFE